MCFELHADQDIQKQREYGRVASPDIYYSEASDENNSSDSINLQCYQARHVYTFSYIIMWQIHHVHEFESCVARLVVKESVCLLSLSSFHNSCEIEPSVYLSMKILWI